MYHYPYEEADQGLDMQHTNFPHHSSPLICTLTPPRSPHDDAGSPTFDASDSPSGSCGRQRSDSLPSLSYSPTSTASSSSSPSASLWTLPDSPPPITRCKRPSAFVFGQSLADDQHQHGSPLLSPLSSLSSDDEDGDDVLGLESPRSPFASLPCLHDSPRSPLSSLPDDDWQYAGDDADIAPYPPSLTPPRFISVSPLSTALSPSDPFTEVVREGENNEFLQLLTLQRKSREQLQCFESPPPPPPPPPPAATSFSGPFLRRDSVPPPPPTKAAVVPPSGVAGFTKVARKAVKDRCKEVEGLIRFGLEKCHRFSPTNGRASFFDSPAGDAMDVDPDATPTQEMPEPFGAPHDASTLLFTSSPVQHVKTKKPPPSTIHHLVSKMILKRREKAGCGRSMSLGRSGVVFCNGVAQRPLTAAQANQSKLRTSLQVDDLVRDEADSVVPDREQEDILMGDDEEEEGEDVLDGLGLTGFG